MRLIVKRLVKDEGTVVVFEGQDEELLARLQPGALDHLGTLERARERLAIRNSMSWWFAADHRPARDIAAALEAGEEVHVDVEPWQVIGQVPA